MLPQDFSLSHAAAMALIFICWCAYTPALSTLSRGSLNARLAVVRRHWLMAATRRDAKPVDGILLGHIVNSIAFFGSATLIVLAALISTLAAVKSLHGTISELHFISNVSLELFAMEIAFLALVIAVSFFSFTYALRKLIYTTALIGALPDISENCPTLDDLVTASATVLSEAIKTFNFGIRGYYYSVAALCLFVSPAASMIASVILTGILVYRQLATPTARAIEDYVEAAKRIGE